MWNDQFSCCIAVQCLSVHLPQLATWLIGVLCFLVSTVGTTLRTDLPRHLCGIGINGTGCSSTTFDTYGIEYKQVCGKIIEYQDQTPDALSQGQSQPINGHYVEGIIPISSAVENGSCFRNQRGLLRSQQSLRGPQPAPSHSESSP